MKLKITPTCILILNVLIVAKFIPRVNLKIIPSLWGHIAGAGFAKEDADFINKQITVFIK